MKWILLPLLVLLPLCTWGQEQKARLKVAYLGGQLTHPGLSLGYSKSFHQTFKQKAKRKEIRKEWRYGLNLSAYYHKDLHSGLYFTPQLEWLRTGQRGGQIGFSLNYSVRPFSNL